jgi:hypothetical protein
MSDKNQAMTLAERVGELAASSAMSWQEAFGIVMGAAGLLDAARERDHLRAELEKVKVNDALRCDVRDLIESASGEPVFPPLMDAVMSAVRPLRAAVDAALALAEEFDAEAQRFSDKFAGYPEQSAYQGGRTDSYEDAAERIRVALAPVADPDPHTTSNEETSNG